MGEWLPPTWAFAKVDAQISWNNDSASIADQARMIAARLIAEHEEPPIDPLLVEAIELVCSESITRTENQLAAIRNRQACNDKVELAFAALHRGIELGSSSHDR